MLLACFVANSNVSAHWKHTQENLPFGMIQFAFKFEKKSLYHQGFFAVKRRAVFIFMNRDISVSGVSGVSGVSDDSWLSEYINCGGDFGRGVKFFEKIFVEIFVFHI